MHVAYLCGLPAHPRVSGENRFATRARWGALGSSPRERGKRRRGQCIINHARLIPA